MVLEMRTCLAFKHFFQECLWLRAIDVFNYSFPFGIGHGMYTLYINESFVPQVAESIVFRKIKGGLLWYISKQKCILPYVPSFNSLVILIFLD